ncbi:hypothetical protein N5D52_14870 [Pseudomonas sp. GD03860]|uniref:hypothetical protein n=1 Tax=Pseudomonas TaxID=286 RepID=UPI0023640879|nr:MULTISPECIES: hypothetical protein [Pseudomonas]MDD2056576.1 hypothetical protein [Pseudomonas putida]MDH0638228.1 hypothetical protein [Pseudomonas sp. GD03860]
MSRHEKAVEIIDARFDALRQSSSAMLHGETSMAIEMAYALGAIGTDLYRHYVARRHKILERDHQQTMESMGRHQ